MRRFALLSLFALVGLLAGCSTFDSRSQEKSATFSNLDPATQERLRVREIHVGDSFDMVYIALGAPDEKREKVTKDGASTTWVYNAYWQEYRGEVVTGYRRYTVYDKERKVYRVYYEPVRQSVYTPHVEERMRVQFENGAVESIEEAKRT